MPKLLRRINSFRRSINEKDNVSVVGEKRDFSRSIGNGDTPSLSEDVSFSNRAPTIRNESSASLNLIPSKMPKLAPIAKNQYNGSNVTSMVDMNTNNGSRMKRRSGNNHPCLRGRHKCLYEYWLVGVVALSCSYCYIQTKNLKYHTLLLSTEKQNSAASPYAYNNQIIYNLLHPTSESNKVVRAPHESMITIQQFWNTSLSNQIQRSHERRLRTKPPIYNIKAAKKNDFHINKDNFHLQEYEYAFLKQNYPNTYSRNNLNDDYESWIPADLKHLCGIDSKKAASRYPNHYPSQHALSHKINTKKKYKKNNHNPQRFYRPNNFDSSLKQEPRVLITGILNPIGFMLALKLGHECQISTIMGFDNMQPNTLLHRQEMLRRVGILRREIPSLQDYLDINVPIFGLNPRLTKADKRRLSKEGVNTTTTTSRFMNNTNASILIEATGEWNLMETFAPTHIIHLASAFKTYPSKLGDNPSYTLKHTTASMEYILSSIASSSKKFENNFKGNIPHLTYISTIPSQEYDCGQNFGQTSKILEIFLTRTYHDLYGVISLGLQVDTVYGPMGTLGMPSYDLASYLTSSNCWDKIDDKKNDKTRDTCDSDHLFNVTSNKHFDAANNSKRHNYLFVDDVVDTIITAMQYHNKNYGSYLLELKSSDDLNYHELIQIMLLFIPRNSSPHPSTVIKSRVLSSETGENNNQNGVASDHLQWNAKSNLFHGLSRLLAWHLDHHRPFNNDLSVDIIPKKEGNNFQKEITQKISLESGNQFLKRISLYPQKNNNEIDMICRTSDTVCLRDKTIFPCASECSDTQLCERSPLDDIVDVTDKNITKNCFIVVYTLVSDDVQNGHDLKEPPNKMNKIQFDPRTICYVAFMSQQRQKELISKEELGKDIKYKGWSIAVIPDWTSFGEEKLKLLLKLSPIRIFNIDVQFSMYMENSLEKSPPSFDDVLFLVDSMYTNDSTNANVSPLFQVNSLFHGTGRHKNKLGDAIAAMKQEYDWEKTSKGHLRIPIMPQSTFYSYYLSNINNKDYRSIYEPSYVLELIFWIDGITVVHNLRKEDARQLRCEWYSEHMQFENKLDQLSLAMVMARRELFRKIIRKEPDEVESRSEKMKENTIHDMKKKTSTDFTKVWPLPASVEVSNHRTFTSNDPAKHFVDSYVKMRDREAKDRDEWNLNRERMFLFWEMKNKKKKLKENK